MTTQFNFDRFIDPFALRMARNLCADSGDHNPEYVRGIAELLIDVSPFLNQDVHKQPLIDFLGAPEFNPNGPLTSEQRRAMFAAFGEVFGHTEQATRLAFTAMVLSKNPAEEAISWSRHKPGALTAGEASKVLDALNVLNV